MRRALQSHPDGIACLVSQKSCTSDSYCREASCGEVYAASLWQKSSCSQSFRLEVQNCEGCRLETYFDTPISVQHVFLAFASDPTSCGYIDFARQGYCLI